MKPIYVEFNAISVNIDHTINPVSIRLDIINNYGPCSPEECKISGGTFISSQLGTWLVKETYEEVKAIILDACERQVRG